MAATPTAVATADQASFVPGELIVRYERSASAAERIELRRDHDAHFGRKLALPRTELIRLESGQSVKVTAAVLGREDEVVYAEPNYVYRATTPPTDTWFDQLWGLNNTGQAINVSPTPVSGTVDADIDALEAWDITTGSTAVTVAVVDSGVAYTHADLAPNAYRNPAESGGGKESDGVDDDAIYPTNYIDDYQGWDWVQSDNDPSDANGHGTHVAGILGARGNDGAGVAGVSWNSKIMPLRVLGANGQGTGADLISAFNYAGTRGARVVNASLGGPGFSQTVYDSINAYPNTLFVVAAGNGGGDQAGDDNDAGNAQNTTYPCTDPPLGDHDNNPATPDTQPSPLPNLICVAATDQNDGLATFSNYGATSVDLAAPGMNIWSTQPAAIAAAEFSYKSGTSMATPFVSGVAALLWARTPAATVAYVRSALLTSIDSKPALTGKVASGGRLNALRALGTEPPVQQASPPPAPPAAAPAAEPAPVAAPASPPPAPAPVVPKPPDLRAPVASIATRLRHRLDSVLASGLGVTCRADEAGVCSLALSLNLATARRLGIRGTRRNRRVVIGEVKARLGANSSRRLTLRLTASARRGLIRAVRDARRPTKLSALLQVTVADDAANATSGRQRLAFLIKPFTRPVGAGRS